MNTACPSTASMPGTHPPPEYHSTPLATGAKVSADDHRAIAVDKDAWDRNYGLKPPQTGKSACSLIALHSAQLKGRELGCTWCVDELPTDWQSLLVPGAITTVGVDPATTEKDKSNPHRP